MAKEIIQEEQTIIERGLNEGKARTTGLRCWDCLTQVENFFCKSCERIQPIPLNADYFQYFGFERKLKVDPIVLENRFHALSRKFHPDFYQSKSFKEQELSLENASALNKAYRVLREPISRVEYLIQLELGEGEGIRCQVPPDLLEEVLDLHAQLEEIHQLKENSDSSAAVKIKEFLRSELIKLEVRFKAINDQIQALSDQWDLLNTADRERHPDTKKLLIEMRNILSQRTYLSNVIEEIKKTLV
ncbi:MAG: Fe-S protein assembly co-chaperone HscB [Nitrospiria bacterium]